MKRIATLTLCLALVSIPNIKPIYTAVKSVKPVSVSIDTGYHFEVPTVSDDPQDPMNGLVRGY